MNTAKPLLPVIVLITFISLNAPYSSLLPGGSDHPVGGTPRPLDDEASQHGVGDADHDAT